MSFDEKTGLDFNGNYHNNDFNVEEDQKIALENGKPSDIIGEIEHNWSPISSDDEYSNIYFDSTVAFQKKHMVRILWCEEMDSAPSVRSVWLSGLLERIKKRWPDNTGTFTTSICVSYHLYNITAAWRSNLTDLATLKHTSH